MRSFRFRPAALLELRRKEEDAARDLLLRTEQARSRAEASLTRATAALLDAARTLGQVQQGGATADTLAWHRSWIHRLRAESAARRSAVEMTATAVQKASVVVRQAVQKRRVLERLHDRAWRRHQDEANREHARQMDEVAIARYFAQRAEGGTDRDDH